MLHRSLPQGTHREKSLQLAEIRSDQGPKPDLKIIAKRMQCAACLGCFTFHRHWISMIGLNHCLRFEGASESPEGLVQTICWNPLLESTIQ